MTRPELDRMLEKAVAEAIGVTYRNSARRGRRPKSPSTRLAVQPQHSSGELQHA
jgi:hypothetical protein